MKVISYIDSYEYSGLWDCTMGYFNEEGTYKALPAFCKTIDVYSCFGTRDSLYMYVSNVENLSIDNLAYVEIERKFDERKLRKEEIKIIYYSKNFERLIPAIMRCYRKFNCKEKITFVYSPVSEKELFDEKNNLETVKEFGWIDNVDDLRKALLSA